MLMKPPSIEENLTTPIVEKSAVMVSGAGPAGIAAAISAARAQRAMGVIPDVRLIEAHGQLGGVWTSGLLSWILDSQNKTGLMPEILKHADAYRLSHGVSTETQGGRLYDPEHMKFLLEKLCVEAGVRVRLHTSVAAANVNAAGRLTMVATHSKSGREAFAADCFIDCTGDGDLASLAGCAYEYGRVGEQDGSQECQPMTLMAMVTGIDVEAARPFFDRSRYSTPEVKSAMYEECRRAGVAPSYTSPTLFEVYPSLFALMANHEYGCDSRDAQQISDVTITARAELHQLITGLRSLGKPWQNLRMVMTAAQIGVRESRRPQGLYRITLEDAVVGRRHADAVCECAFGVDVHSTSKNKGGSIEPKPVPKTKPYDIPYRALVARDVNGLLMAGRCISGDFYAHASYRVTGNSVATGEAVGVAAAVAAHQKITPDQINYIEDVEPIRRRIFASTPSEMPSMKALANGKYESRMKNIAVSSPVPTC